jgi:hypothetical protein
MADVAAEFVAAARAFRHALLADAAERTYARQVRNALARVYLVAALLGPPGAVESDSDSTEPRPDAEESRALRERLKGRLGEDDVFVEVFDPTGITGDRKRPYERSLSWELVEIDEDLAEAIALLEQDAPNALWDVRFAFEQHWGSHAVACLRPLHELATYGVV